MPWKSKKQPTQQPTRPTAQQPQPTAQQPQPTAPQLTPQQPQPTPQQALPIPQPTQPAPQPTQPIAQQPQPTPRQPQPTPQLALPTPQTPAADRGASASASPVVSLVKPSAKLDDDCPRCQRTLVLKENLNPTKSDFPACPAFDEEECAWTGLWVKFAKHCAVCLQTLDIERAAWAYRIPGLPSPSCYLNWHLVKEDCLLLTNDDGVAVNVRRAGDDDVGKSCKSCKRKDDTIKDSDQLVCNSVNPWHVGCALKYRTELELKVCTAADSRLKSYSANKASKASSSASSAGTERKKQRQARQALTPGEKIDFS